MTDVTLSKVNAEHILAEAARAYPKECCGLLLGQWQGNTLEITAVHTSDNVTSGDPNRGFEIDPKLRFDLMRTCENAADGTRIVGHFHSHPDHPAKPSARDLAMAYEPDFVWLICTSSKDGASDLAAFRPNADVDAFDALPLVAR
jgi:proteasome lid subunit RPN8/RPN11